MKRVRTDAMTLLQTKGKSDNDMQPKLVGYTMSFFRAKARMTKVFRAKMETMKEMLT
jgi:hypothetical protein